MIRDKAARYRDRIKASIAIDANGCWIWQKTTQKNGYGVFALGGGKHWRAHRASYFAFVSEIADGLHVCHKCDVRSCVNPEHLFLGTRSENTLDAVRKGRMSKVRSHGERHYAAKLKDGDIPTILERLAKGDTRAAIARDYGVTHRVITLIQSGDSWKHIRRAA